MRFIFIYCIQGSFMADETTNEIHFSQDYLKVLKNLSKALLKCKTPKHVLLFNPEASPSDVMISKTTLKVLINIIADESHARIHNSELGVSDFGELMEFVDAIKYPIAVNSSISYTEHKTKYGQILPNLMLKGSIGTYYLGMARPGMFNADDDKMIPNTPDKDPLILVGEYMMSSDDVDDILSTMKLLGRPEVFGLSITTGVMKWYFKSNTDDKQFTKTIDPLKYRGDVTFNTEDIEVDNSDIRLFPTTFLDILSEFPHDFIIQFRYHQGMKIMALKAYAAIVIEKKLAKGEIAPPPATPIRVLIGTQESSNHTGIGRYDVIL